MHDLQYLRRKGNIFLKTHSDRKRDRRKNNNKTEEEEERGKKKKRKRRAAARTGLPNKARFPYSLKDLSFLDGGAAGFGRVGRIRGGELREPVSPKAGRTSIPNRFT